MKEKERNELLENIKQMESDIITMRAFVEVVKSLDGNEKKDIDEIVDSMVEVIKELEKTLEDARYTAKLLENEQGTESEAQLKLLNVIRDIAGLTH